ncbi:phosphatidate cytidylyltransferase [Clostridiales bacterium KA00134]|nr:phosphatidate cytidylyltransferase [Clostridiales bacterium KA00134]
MNEIQKRVATGVIGGALLALILYLGGLYLQVAILIVDIFMCLELKSALKRKNIKLNLPSMLIGSILIFLEYFYELPFLLPIFAVLFLAFLSILVTDKYNVEDGINTCFAFLYGPVLISTLRFLDKTPFLVLVFLVAFGTDTFAYIVGMNFGKHKLIPKVSPNKSVEGAIGGILGSLILSMFYLYFRGIHLTVWIALFLILASISGQIGDLIASKIKRFTGIKDFGHILPGHGGFMDRFDSILMVAPVIYLAYQILKGVM